jgi:hypothetical protein
MDGSTSTSEKVFTVRQGPTGINSIGTTYGNGANVVTLTQAHSFINGESVRIISDNGQLPDGLLPNNVYYAITTGLSTNTDVKLAKTVTDALNGSALTINEKGGLLKVVSRVSDKNSGDIGHPIQYDSTNSQWYINVSAASTENTIYPTVVGLGSTSLGDATPRTFVRRKSDNRNSTDTLYRLRYVVPKNINSGVARPPSDGYIIQESNTSIGSTDGEIQTYFGSGSLPNENAQRNFRFIADASWDGSKVDVVTELPHNLVVGSEVELVNVTSTFNTTGTAGTAFNRSYIVTGIGSAKHFSVGLSTNPGTFTNDISARTTSLPYFRKKTYKDSFYIYRNQEAQKYVSGEQDGIYYLTVLNASNTPTVSPFTGEKYSQPVKELFPQTNRDNPVSDPDETKCFAISSLIGDVVVNDVRNSVTKETVTKIIRDIDVGVGITDIMSQTGTAHTIYTTIDHGLNKLTAVSVSNVGAGYSDGTHYNAKLVGIGTSTTGSYATAKVVVSSGAVSSVKIMDGGSAYGIGNTLAITGIPTSGSFTEAVVTVDSIYNNVGDTLRVIGVSSEGYAGYNQLYRITGVNVGAATSFNAVSVNSVSGFSSTGVGVTLCTDAFAYLTGEAIRINNLSYDNISGIATITTHNSHGLRVDQKVKLVGFNETSYTGDFVVTEVLDVLASTPTYKFSVNLGVASSAPTPTGAGTTYVYRLGYTSNEGVITENNENIGGRMVANYAGITTTLSSDVPNVTTDEISLTNISNLDVNIGDYLAIDDEIVRVKTTVTGTNPIYVFRGVLGTKPSLHYINGTVRKVFINPTELRRHSINRASGHTFEYVGFGPGNYSTALPDRQDRIITAQEELLAQSTKREGGINFYTGMNDRGISYSGNKKLSTITGIEEIFDTPVQTITGEDIGVIPNINVLNPLEGNFTRSIRVEGGPDNKVSSEFNGPVIINNKLTVNSTKGLEANNLFLQGDATVSRKYSVGIATPALAGNPGDVVYYANPNAGGYVGWIYTLENDWYRFGNVSISKDLNIGIFDQVGIATTSPGNLKFLVGSGSTQFSVDNGEVGVGTTGNGYALHVIGSTNIVGTVTATSFVGDGSLLTNLNASATGWTVVSGGIYNTTLTTVGVGTTAPRFNLELGGVGTASTSLYVNGEAKFVGFITANNVSVTGILTATGAYDLNSSSGKITVGVVTASTIHVGTALTTLYVSGTDVGIGTSSPRAKLDVAGHTRLKTYSEDVEYVTPSSNIITVDLSKAQTFICTATSNITQFTITNPPSGSTEFTIRIDQDGTGSRTVGIDTFRTSSGGVIPVYWPGGGVLPIVTPTASRSDIYTFKVFDGNNLTTAGIYGVVVGQNFAN